MVGITLNLCHHISLITGLSSLLVGAPRANSTYTGHEKLKEPGRVDRCLIGNPETDRCRPLVIDNIGINLCITFDESILTRQIHFFS